MKLLFKVKQKLAKMAIYFEYEIVALFVFFPLFRAGRIFSLDFASVPGATISEFNSPNIVGNIFYWLFNINSLGKIMLVVFFGLLGTGMHLFVRRVIPNATWAAYFSGLLVMLNPWMYSRFLYGQMSTILSAALVPWFLIVFLKLLQQPYIRISFNNIKNIWRIMALPWYAALIVTAMVAVMIHAVFFITIIVLVFSLLFVLKGMVVGGRREFFPFLIRFLKRFLVFAVFFFVFNAYWLFPMFFGTPSSSILISNIIGQRDFLSFQTLADTHHGVIWNTAAMYGFWGDTSQRYAPLKSMVPYWFQLYLVILALSGWGVVSSVIRWIRNAQIKSVNSIVERNVFDGHAPWIVCSFVILGMVSLILALGVAHPSAALMSWWLYAHVPFYKGFREPQKWVALLVVSYAYLGALGVDDLISRIRNGLEKIQIGIKRVRGALLNKIALSIATLVYRITPAFFLIVPLLYTPGMFGGFKGQLCIGDYPKSWFQVNDVLNKDADHFRVLFLPWHEYLSFSFACGRIITNPAGLFFDKLTLSGDNLEMNSIYTESMRPESKYIEGEILGRVSQFARKDTTLDKNQNFQQQITLHETRVSLGDTLLPLNIKYVIVAQESDFFNYGFVGQSSDMVLVYDSSELKVYKNLRWKPEEGNQK